MNRHPGAYITPDPDAEWPSYMTDDAPTKRQLEVLSAWWLLHSVRATARFFGLSALPARALAVREPVQVSYAYEEGNVKPEILAAIEALPTHYPGGYEWEWDCNYGFDGGHGRDEEIEKQHWDDDLVSRQAVIAILKGDADDPR